MKKIITALFILGCLHAAAQNNTYDSVLAKRLGGNDNGMKSYVLVILKSGSYSPKEKNISDSLFNGHMSNMKRLANENKLFVAGPFGKNDLNYRGIFIFNVKTVEEARALVATDPAVKAKLFDVEILPFYCTAALGEIPSLHEKITKPQ
jgi:uncharacterized protein